MDLTLGTIQEKTARAKVSMMWFAMISMFMTFAGLTSAYIVSNTRKDWFNEFEFPVEFFFSLSTVILSSVVFYLMIKAIKANQTKNVTTLLIVEIALGVLFVFLQFKAFSNIAGQGFYFTGPASTISTTFIYVIAVTHLLHIFGGLIVLLIVFVNQLKGKYSSGNFLGLKLASMYWHFVDVLWVYLFCFLYFMR